MKEKIQEKITQYQQELAQMQQASIQMQANINGTQGAIQALELILKEMEESVEVQAE